MLQDFSRYIFKFGGEFLLKAFHFLFLPGKFVCQIFKIFKLKIVLDLAGVGGFRIKTTLLEQVDQSVGFRMIELRGTQLWINGARVKNLLNF